MDMSQRMMVGVVRCKFCSQRPRWRDYKKTDFTEPVSAAFEGHMEHVCKGMDFYLHGRWVEVVDKWCEVNIDNGEPSGKVFIQ